MAHAHSKYADFEGLRERAVALRRGGYSLRQIRDELGVYNNEILQRLVEGEPPPEWTKRPRAKDDLRKRARELRRQGWTYKQIQTELGCSKSSVSLWVRDLPTPPARRTPEEQRELMNAGLARLRAALEQERAETKRQAAAAIGELSDRELFIAGVALYWAEGAKDKPHRRTEVLQFINSDANVIRLFLRWLELLEVTRDRLTIRVSIHETADVAAAEKYWADVVGVEVSAFSRATLKKHNPRTVRKNTGDNYHGCLAIYVRQSADLYRRMEGAWYGIVGAAPAPDLRNRT
ncbi:helix-turn-helix domain-containing protein [Streptomyces sp. KM273126]|uniref:helix-turn-helix domain-containing protein n=1 Tax=Streptomyces sp. KM273126 TaxID=2545247 RepID=UPI00103F50EF|nr:helix-turn-helix domain-containing protein [Streptomyces sp. KM273126]MBA2806754.1 helix-turn-helix domain-containing protein [Streptomyces sp. KM273126]